MGFLRKLLGVKTIDEGIRDLEYAIKELNNSVFNYLVKELYEAKYGYNTTLWATAVLNCMLCYPQHVQAKDFHDKNEDAIWQESLQIKKYPGLSGTSGGASYLYFAEMFYATAMMNNPHINRKDKDGHMARGIDLEERAYQLGIFVPSVRENMRNSKEPLFIIDCISTFSKSYSKKY